MPQLTGDTLEVMNVKGTNFQYSGTRIQNLGATEYTLVTIVTDVSGSVSAFRDELEACLKEIISACRRSPRADNLMIRLLTFNTFGNEVHGYKLLTECNVDDYENILHTGGGTALYDATANAVMATSDYGKVLTNSDYDVNAIVFVITDGDDNSSTLSMNQVREALDNVVKSESVESLVSVLIGVNVKEPEIDQYLNDYHKNAGFTQYVKIDDANEKTLAKLAEFVSKSISSQSNSLGSGNASNQQSLTI